MAFDDDKPKTSSHDVCKTFMKSLTLRIGIVVHLSFCSLGFCKFHWVVKIIVNCAAEIWASREKAV